MEPGDLRHDLTLETHLSWGVQLVFVYQTFGGAKQAKIDSCGMYMIKTCWTCFWITLIQRYSERIFVKHALKVLRRQLVMGIMGMVASVSPFTVVGVIATCFNFHWEMEIHLTQPLSCIYHVWWWNLFIPIKRHKWPNCCPIGNMTQTRGWQTGRQHNAETSCSEKLGQRRVQPLHLCPNHESYYPSTCVKRDMCNVLYMYANRYTSAHAQNCNNVYACIYWLKMIIKYR